MQKGLITQLVRPWLGISLKAVDKGMRTDFQYNLLCFIEQHPFRFLIFVTKTLSFSLWACGVVVQQWMPWDGSLGAGQHRGDALSSPKANHSHFLLTMAWLWERSRRNTSLGWTHLRLWPWDTGVRTCSYGVCSYAQPHENRCVRWLVAKQRWLEIKYQKQWAFCSCTRPAERQGLALLNASAFLSSVAPPASWNHSLPSREELEGTSLHYKFLGGTRKQCKTPLS